MANVWAFRSREPIWVSIYVWTKEVAFFWKGTVYTGIEVAYYIDRMAGTITVHDFL